MLCCAVLLCESEVAIDRRCSLLRSTACSTACSLRILLAVLAAHCSLLALAPKHNHNQTASLRPPSATILGQLSNPKQNRPEIQDHHQPPSVIGQLS